MSEEYINSFLSNCLALKIYIYTHTCVYALEAQHNIISSIPLKPVHPLLKF